MALPPVSSIVPLVTVVAEVPSDSSIWKSKRKVFNWPNQMQGAAHTGYNTIACMLQQWQQRGKSHEPARLYCAIYYKCLLENTVVFSVICKCNVVVFVTRYYS